MYNYVYKNTNYTSLLLWKIAEEVQSSGGRSAIGAAVNGVFCPQFIKYFLRHWAPIVSLWTPLVLRLTSVMIYPTNATAEAMNGVVKQSYMREELRWSIDEFVSEMAGEYA